MLLHHTLRILSHTPTPSRAQGNQCLGGRCSERVCAALILRPPKCIQSITIGNIKRLDITTYCSKMKKKYLI